VLATGFDAYTAPLTGLGITGPDGRTLADKWRNGPKTLFGIASHGFPNLFMISGPLSPAPYANTELVTEEHVEIIGDAIRYVLAHSHRTIEVEREAEETWSTTADAIASHTLVPKADSWLVGSNVPGKARVTLARLAGLPAYREAIGEAVRNGYRGFLLS
jgi:cation diffusion facilitator CzcD-associated flavoprotein CzcO